MDTAGEQRTTGSTADEAADAALIAETYRRREAAQVLKNLRICAGSLPITALVLLAATGSGYDIFGGLLLAVCLAAYARLMRRYHALTGQWRFL
ncbi:hypothetical protein [Azospirillum halopraeferens]|uniref:hypothetical protein n=1 Tax=Azospirillum halopraeferens TaxID=34010 RepID=UPI0003FE2E0B|nr:hypothetical protein [Azospirillum halopraeferens]